MTTATRPRGKAAQPRHLRPGYVIKDVLSGILPLMRRSEADPTVLEELTVHEACITDLSFTYKQLIKRENERRPRGYKLHGMVYSSFVKVVKFAQLLGLVELVREEPMLYSPGALLSIRDHALHEVVESVRRIFRLTSNGQSEDAAWRDLRRAWSEGWTIPTTLPAEELPVVEVPIPAVPPPPIPEVPIEILPVPIAAGAKLGVRNIRKVINYLETVASAPPSPELTNVLDTLEARLGDWEIELESTVEKYEGQRDWRGAEKARSRLIKVIEAREALERRELSVATGALRELLKR